MTADKARAGLEQWTKWGIVEAAVRNPQVAEYCKHWEGRAEKAEVALAAAQDAVKTVRTMLDIDEVSEARTFLWLFIASLPTPPDTEEDNGK